MKKAFPLLACPFLLAGCDGMQSAMSGLGPEAERTLVLTWVMTIGAAAIFLFVLVLTVVAMAGPAGWRRRLSGEGIVTWLGIVFPVVTLTLLLFYGFGLMRAGSTPPGEGEPLRIAVNGERWWWRVTYEHTDGTTTESANELRVPVGRTVELSLTSDNVLHSFWVPAYAGKVDMVPGRTNTLRFAADEPGIVRGQCAEYCGGPHALMSFYVVAMEPAAFEEWMARERGGAVETAAAAGRELFLSAGCGACHTVRGTPADGAIGPDLTHLGGRVSLGAGIMPMGEAALARWIAEHRQIKPDNLMPPFDVFTPDERAAMAAWLAELE